MGRIESRPVPADGLTELRRLWEQRFGRPEPEKIVCVGLNYKDHAAEQGAELPGEPLLFAKFPNTLSGPGDAIVLPPESAHVDAEAELAIVIGAEGRRVSEANALELVAGYTAANDVTARDLQARDGQWLRAKGFDTFCPLLPAVVPVSELGDASSVRVVQRLNGDALQDSSTAELIFGVARLVAHASTVFTLRPGDLILTGTPAGVGVHRKPPVALSDGDIVEVEIEGIGTLSNPVVQG
jgi:2-keto-4-pentenoate hydratase/2-oxohepta-3-ene-1,7-dioic acid hydratase in catechol pathway